MPKGNILRVPVEDEMKDAYLNYAMSVIVSRALPDVRDGLKPSQRRILYAMYDLNLGPNAKHRKCAKICGDTSGNYHPHGEQVIYPTLVRMAQEFVMRAPLVDGQGNFGSIDGDPPAAMRYTEARLTPVAMLMLEDLEKNTVPFVANYDETREEPVVLPSKFPNLIVNGATGIAVGMATSIPPHNLGEVVGACVALIAKPDSAIPELLQHVKGPDFPTGAEIHGRKGIVEAYTTGRGNITVRAKTHVEKGAIVIDEIPYGLSKSDLIEEIATLVKEEKIRGISDIRDESDRQGIRVVIEINKGENETLILNQLFAHTKLQNTFSIIMIALVNGRPKLLNLKELLQAYIDHRKDIIIKRTRFLLEKARAHAHILEGLLNAIDIIDQIIQTIRRSENEPAAQEALVSKFGFTVEQAAAILKMTLGRLTRLEKDKLFKELTDVYDKIAEYNAILADETMVLDIVREDLFEMKEKFGDKRRTAIIESEVQEIKEEELIREEAVLVTLTALGYVKRVALDSYKTGRGVVGAEIKEGDSAKLLLPASTLETVLFFTNQGHVYPIRAHDLPAFEKSSRGKNIASVLGLDPGERVTAACVAAGKFLVLATAKGFVKKTDIGEFGRRASTAIKLEDKDEVVAAMITDGKQQLMMATAGGAAIRFSEEDLRPMGRAAYGVRGIELEPGDRVVGMCAVERKAKLLTVCAGGTGRRTDFEEYRLQGRGGTGIINVTFRPRTAPPGAAPGAGVSPRSGEVVGIAAVGEADEVILISRQGIVFRVRAREISEMNRGAQGRKIVDLEGEDTVAFFVTLGTGPSRQGPGPLF